MAEKFGMMAKDSGLMPLLGVRVTGEICGRGARLCAAQRYRNPEKKPLEVVYRFPLPARSTVCGFRALVGENVFQGAVEEREEAFRRYDKALAEGYGAFLADRERPNIFTLSLGNLEPGREAVVEIEWLMDLDAEKERYRFCLPTTIAPRYLPADTPEDDGIPEDEKILPPYAWRVDYGLSLSLEVTGLPENCLVESPSHPVRVAASPGRANVSLACESARMDRDFVLYLGRAGDDRVARRESGTENDYYRLDFCIPEAKKGRGSGKKAAREYTFLLDCSGSMAGESISQARRALEICLRGLEEGCLFNAWRFGSSHEKMFEQAVPYSDSAVNEALGQLTSWDADLGGTEILAPLRDICSREPADGLQREIIVLTDGEVGNEDEVGALVRAHSAVGRFSVLGIGAAANDHLVESLSRAGGGYFGYVFPGENIERKCLELFSRVMSERITDLRVKWPGPDAWQAPSEPIASVGRPLSVFCRLPRAESPPEKIEVSFRREKKTEVVSVPVVNAGEGRTVRLAWARQAIGDLEDGRLATGSQQKERKMADVRGQIVSLSRDYGVLSAHTSMVAVEERPEREKTRQRSELRRIPALVAGGWHGFPMPAAHEPLGLNADMRMSIKRTPMRESGPGILSEIAAYSSPLPVRKDYRLSHLLISQRPEGGFVPTGKLCLAFKFRRKDLAEAAGKLSALKGEDAFAAIATAVFLAILEQFFSDESDTWEPLARKSREWLEKLTAQERPRLEGKPLEEWARAFAAGISGLD